MTNVDLVREITDLFSRNKRDKDALAQYFSSDFQHWANGKRSDLGGYAAHLAKYGEAYEGFTIPQWDELFAADDKVVASYALEGKKKGGGTDRMAVMAIWRFKDGKVVSLREVDAPL